MYSRYTIQRFDSTFEAPGASGRLAVYAVYAVYAGAGLFDIAAVPNGSEYPPEHRTPLCIHCDW
jgi:hypothetical protein